MREDEKLITVAEFESGFDAELAKVALENEGIESVVFGEDLVVNLPHIQTIHIELRVFEKDLEQAMRILAEHEPLEEDDESDAAEE